MHCSRCGGQLDPGSAFCSACGNPVAAGLEIPFRRPPIVTVLAVLQIVGSAMALPGAVMALAMGPFYVPSQAGSGFATSVGLAFLIPFVAAAIGALQLGCAIGLLKLKPYGRTLQLVLAWIGLIGFPIGTIVAVLVLVYFSKPGIRALFSGKPRSEMSERELTNIAAVTGGASSAVVVVITIAVVALAAVALIGIVAAIAVPGLMRARMSGDEAVAMGSLRAIYSGESTYAMACAGGGYAVTLQDLARPPKGGGEGFVPADLGMNGVTKSGYRITLTRELAAGVMDVGTAAATCNGSTAAPASGYFASAEPTAPGTSGVRYFATDARGIIFQSDRPIANPIRPSAAVVPIQ
jgi:type IV pilus assembly protein PilA